jgi:hypothetical protein
MPTHMQQAGAMLQQKSGRGSCRPSAAQQSTMKKLRSLLEGYEHADDKNYAVNPRQCDQANRNWEGASQPRADPRYHKRDGNQQGGDYERLALGLYRGVQSSASRFYNAEQKIEPVEYRPPFGCSRKVWISGA